MRACLFGTYDRAHSANRLLRMALAGAGFEVVELHEPLWEQRRYKQGGYFRSTSLLSLGARYAQVARRLAVRWRALGGPPPLVVAGFGGQLDVLLASQICRPRAGLVFAPLVSLSETLVEDRRVFAAGSLKARATAALDRATLRAPDLVLADTAAHATYLAELGAPASRVAAWHLGVEPEFLPAQVTAPIPRRVLFYGRYLPLHGIDTIVTAAARLAEPADVVLIGGGPERERIEAVVGVSGASITLRDEIPLAALPAELAAASIVLGVFGDGRKAAMVVPNKVYQAAAAGRPLVTRDGPALREVLTPDEHCLACPPGDPDALAGAIDRLLLTGAGRSPRTRGARHILERFSPERQAARLRVLLADRLGVVTSATPSRRVADG